MPTIDDYKRGIAALWEELKNDSRPVAHRGIYQGEEWEEAVLYDHEGTSLDSADTLDELILKLGEK